MTFKTRICWTQIVAMVAAAVLLVVAGGACSPSRTSHAAGAPVEPTVILIGLDGFRWDFVERTETPALDRLIASGVRAERLVPVFPTKTFPNHYSIATGLYPEHHGVVSNTMYDPDFDAWFRLSDRDAVSDGRWWGGEPIWVTAEKQGIRSAAFFWPGTEAAIGGVRPTFWKPFDNSVPRTERVRQVLSWLDLPEEHRPRMVTMYFSDVDGATHEHGPQDGPEVSAAIRAVDGSVGMLLRGLDERGLTEHVNLIVVSDHGMAATSPERVILLDDFVDLERANVVDWNPVLALRPDAEAVDDVYRSLHSAHPNLQVFRRHHVPDRLHYRNHRRIAPIIGLADEGWSITTRARFERAPERFRGGNHGYDNQLVSMGGLFVAAGPAFKQGALVPAIESIHIYSLMCHVLGLTPAANDGQLDAIRSVLRTG